MDPHNTDSVDAPAARPWRAWLIRIGGVAWLGVFGWALYGLHREWSGFHFADFDAALMRLGFAHLALAGGCVAASYFCASLLGVIGQRWLGQARRHWTRELGENFIMAAFTMNAGGSVLGGGGLRLRFAAERGLGPVEAGKATAFCALAGWAGHMVLVGGLLVVGGSPVEWLSGTVAEVVGAALLLLGVALVFAGRFVRRGWPSPGAAGLALGVAVLDWLFAGLTLWALLPGQGVPVLTVVTVVILAQALASLTHVPGGVGVLELALVKALGGLIAAPLLAGALVVYRLIYYVAPFAVAVLLLGLRMAHRRREAVARGGRIVARGWAMMAPRLAALFALGGGFMLLLSANTPMEAGRRGLVDLLPLPFVEASHFISSLAGALLIVLAHGLRRRIRAAWWLCVGVVGGGVVFSLVKGFDWEEALVLCGLLACLLGNRTYFHRQAALWTHRFTAGWWVLLVALMGASVWVGFFAARHVPYSDELWWRFTLEGDAPRFLRASAGAAVVLLLAGLAQALRPAAPRRVRVTDPALVDKLVAASPQADAALAWLGDKEFTVSEDGRCGLMHADQGRSRIVLGDPLGETDEADDLLWSFVEQTRDEGRRTVFYQVSAEEMPRLVDMGFRLYKLGEQATVELADFTLEGGDAKRLRQTRGRFQKEGLRFEIWPPERVAAEMAALQVVSDAWLAEHRAGEKGFSLGRFAPDYLRRFSCAVARDQGGRVVAFANILRGGGGSELSVDLMRQLPDAPTGVMEAMFVELLVWGREQGCARFNLGMAPLSGLSRHSLAPTWHKIAANIFERGGDFYNFRGLRGYKEKFRPKWTPRYIAVSGPWSLPIALFDVTVLVGGGLRGTFMRKSGGAG